MGVLAGYHSARTYKMFKGIYWLRCTILTAVSYPLTIMITFIIIDIFLAAEKSTSETSAAVSLCYFNYNFKVGLNIILQLIIYWFCISVPLVFLGSFIGFKRRTIKNSADYNIVPKTIKAKPWYLKNTSICIIGGLLPFGSFFVEL